MPSVNFLQKKLNKKNKGLKIGIMQIRLLTFADDLTLITEKRKNMQTLLNKLSSAMRKDKMSLNEKKTIHTTNAKKKIV